MSHRTQRYLDKLIDATVDENTPENNIPTSLGYGYMTKQSENSVYHKPVRGRVFLQKGNIYRHHSTGQQYELVDYLDESCEVIVRSLQDFKTTIMPIDSLENLTDDNNQHIHVDLSAIGDEAWQRAQTKFEAIRPILTTFHHGQVVKERAAEIGVSERTLYRWIKDYNSLHSIAGLVDRKRGWQKNQSRLSAAQDNLIAQVINEFYLGKQRMSLEHTYREVFRRCALEGIKQPSKKAIRHRILQLSQREVLAKRGQKALADKRFKPTPFNFPNADFPLSVVQIDHTPVDLILVDDQHRKPIGRPYLTLAIDVYSRMITGYYLSLDAPSITSVAMCLARSILPKDKLLSEHGIKNAEWNNFGYPQKIHVDNAAEFQSNTFAQSCALHGIQLEFRPIGRTHYGGHIERLIGTNMREVHSIPGTTFSNIKQRDTYDSEKEASMTFSEFEAWLITFISKVYHKRVHKGIGRSPAEQWRIGIFGDGETMGVGVPSLPRDQQTLLLDFLPSFERTIQHFGVTIDGLTYYDVALNAFINQVDEKGRKVKFLFRRDPRDISKLWFYDPLLNRYAIVPFANQQLPAMSLWEYKAVRNHISSKGVCASDAQIYQALTEMREMVASSSQNTKRARRQAQRQKTHAKVQQATAQKPYNQAGAYKIKEPYVSPLPDMNKHTSVQDGQLLCDEFDFDLGEID